MTRSATHRAPYVDPMTPDPREERLPVWAAAAIERLRSRVTAAERQAEEARLGGGPADTDALLEPYSNVPIRLPKGTRVRFLITPEEPGDGIHTDWVDVYVSRDALSPYVALHGGNGLAISPQSSNVARVRTTDVY